MTRYRAIRINTTGEPAMNDDEARAMFGLPPRVEDEEAAEQARELLGGVGLTAVPEGAHEVDLSGDGQGAEEAHSAAE